MCRQRGNLDRLRVRGLETELEYALRSGLDGSLSYLYSDNRVERAVDYPELEQLRTVQTPRHSAVASLRFTDPRTLKRNPARTVPGPSI